jgi:hypothetical protein
VCVLKFYHSRICLKQAEITAARKEIDDLKRRLHYWTQTRCRRLAKNTVGIVCANGDRRYLDIGLGGRRHRPTVGLGGRQHRPTVGLGGRRHRSYSRWHRSSRRHSYRTMAVTSHRHSKAVATCNFSYFKKNEFLKKNQKNIYNFLFSLIF